MALKGIIGDYGGIAEIEIVVESCRTGNSGL